MPMLMQLMVTGIWAMTIVVHARRLVRLARIEQLRNWEETRLRMGLNRIWWWLGQDEFWRGVMPDCLKAIEVSVLIFLIAWGMSQ